MADADDDDNDGEDDDGDIVVSVLYQWVDGWWGQREFSVDLNLLQLLHDETDDGGDDQDDDNDVTCDNDDKDETGDVWIFFYIHPVTIQL